MTSQKVFCFGDSLTAGDSPPHYEKYPFAPHLEKNLRSNKNGNFDSALVRWKGFPGWTAENLLTEGDLPGSIDNIIEKAGSLDLVIILAGTNDLGFNRDSDEIFHSIRKLHEISHDRGVKTLALGIPPSAWQSQSKSAMDCADAVNSRIQAWANSSDDLLSLVTFDHFPIKKFDAQSGYWSGDGLHFSPEGYRHIGESLGSIVAHILCEAKEIE